MHGGSSRLLAGGGRWVKLGEDHGRAAFDLCSCERLHAFEEQALQVSALVGLEELADLAREESGALTGADIEFAPATDAIRNTDQLLARRHYEAILSILVALIKLGIAVDGRLKEWHLLTGGCLSCVLLLLPELPEAECCHGRRHSRCSAPVAFACKLVEHRRRFKFSKYILNVI